MTTEKKQTLYRVILYTLFAYLPTYILIPVFGYAEDDFASKMSMLLISFSPMLANILTRLITREGKTDLRIAVKRGRQTPLCFVLSLLPIVFCTVGVIVSFCVLKNSKMVFDTLHTMLKSDIVNHVGTFAYTAAFCIPLAFIYFGEEFGWRGYLTPKLCELLPKPAAHIVSGMIWGLWHAPMIANGHNFGKDYDFFPWAGYGVMCLFCICMGVFFTTLTERSGSVLPACIAHSLNNNIYSLVLLLLLAADPALMPESQFALASLGIVPMALCALIVGLLLPQKRRLGADAGKTAEAAS